MQGRSFALVEGRVLPPRGDYVAYGGRFFPVSPKTGYPLSVVADIAAGQPGKIVLLAAEGVLAFLSGSGRVIHTPLDVDADGKQSDAFYRSLLRLTLLSDHQKVVVLSDIPALGSIPFDRVDLANLTLPPVIKRSRSWLMLALFMSLVLAGVLSAIAVKSIARAKAETASMEVATAEQEMSAALEAVKEGRIKLGAVTTPSMVPIGSEVLPQRQGSFLSQFYANKTPPTNMIRVKNGQFQY